ncbi:UNVERIFIED_CONTAM: hypothetical protein K2H54_066817 [Gekko kuhli]
MELPKGLQGVGPGNNEDTLLSAVASALHTSSAPITGQLSAAVEKNPAVWLNTSQPLCKAFIVTDEDISLTGLSKPIKVSGTKMFQKQEADVGILTSSCALLSLQLAGQMSPDPNSHDNLQPRLEMATDDQN